jgi:hypothetical protein
LVSRNFSRYVRAWEEPGGLLTVQRGAAIPAGAEGSAVVPATRRMREHWKMSFPWQKRGKRARFATLGSVMHTLSANAPVFRPGRGGLGVRLGFPA